MTRFFLILVVLSIPAVSTAQLIQEADMTYLGAFRVPQGSYNGISYAWGGAGIGYYQANNSLFILSIYGENAAEMSIASPVITSDLDNLNIASNLQAWVDITEGNLDNVGEGGAPCTGNRNLMGGIFVYGGDMYVSVYNYYDAGYCAELSHFISGLTLNTASDFDGMYRVGDQTYNVGVKANYMCNVPSEWRPSFGGAPAFTGRSFGAILGRSSFGPSISTFYPDSVGIVEPSPSKVITWYDDAGDNATFGGYADGFDGGGGSPNPYVSPRDIVNGVIFPEGTDSVLFFGTHGNGEWCYKCPEPNNPAGNGAYPYQYFVWAYDANDLAASYADTYTVTQDDFNAGRFIDGVFPNNTVLAVGDTVKPWHIAPYDTWELAVPIVPDTSFTYDKDLIGATYDPATGQIYISTAFADGTRPLIHVYDLDVEVSGGVTFGSASVTDNVLTIGWTDAASSDWQVQATINGTTSYTILVDSASASFPVAAGTIDIKITGNASGTAQGGASSS